MPRKPTIRDVARRAGVSKSLVSMVIRGEPNVSEQSRLAIRSAADELGYRPNMMARSLAERRTKILGVMISDLSNPFFAAVEAGIQAQASELGFTVLFNTGGRRPEAEEQAIESFLELRVDGLILAGPSVETGAILAVTDQVPVVVLNRTVNEPSLDSVTNDDVAGAQMAVEHLASLGHRRIAHIDGGGGAGSLERRNGYLAAMKRLGLEEHVSVGPGSFTEAGGYRGARQLLRMHPVPTAIFAANDLCAIGALNAIEEAGFAVPDDISLIGYDNSSLASLRHLSLSSIDQPGEELGRMAVARLYERIEGDRTEARHDVVAPGLVARSTTAPPRERPPVSDGGEE